MEVNVIILLFRKVLLNGMPVQVKLMKLQLQLFICPSWMKFCCGAREVKLLIHKVRCTKYVVQ